MAERNRPPAGVSGGRLVVIIVGTLVRQAAATVFSGVPSNARLHLTVRSPRVRRARRQAWADLRARVDATAAAVPSAHLLCCRYVDAASRVSRSGNVSMFGSGGRVKGALALVATLSAEAWFGTDADPEQALRELTGSTDGPWQQRPRGWFSPPNTRWERDSTGRLLTWEEGSRRRNRHIILRTERTEPADWSITGARAQYGTLLRWAEFTAYFTVPQRPWLGASARLWQRLKRSGPARPGRA